MPVLLVRSFSTLVTSALQLAIDDDGITFDNGPDGLGNFLSPD